MAYRVFLSSTSRDLAEHREAIHRAIDALDGFELIKIESFGARDTDARGIDEQMLGKADLLVGLMGHCYGSSPPDDPTSFTEQEYDFAVGRQLPRLMFVAPDDFAVPQNLIEPDDKRARQKAFRKRVMVERVVASFRSPEELATGVTTALSNPCGRAGAGVRRRPEGARGAAGRGPGAGRPGAGAGRAAADRAGAGAPA